MESTAALRTLHPLAWWAWAIGIGIAVNATTNPLLLALLAVAMLVVVLARRSSAPWARSIGAYLALAGFVIGIRVLFQLLIGAHAGSTVLFSLPEVPLPAWAAGIRLGGPVSMEALAATGYDALRLAVLLFAVGAANALASPRQALRSVPAALYEASVAVVVALNVAPQLIESGQRVRRARRLRGEDARGLASLGPIALSVLADAIDRSMALAAGMEARGFARTSSRPVGGPILIAAASLATLGAFLLLSTEFRLLATGLLLVGTVTMIWGLRRAGTRLGVTRYRPHRWGWPEHGTIASAAAIATVVLWIGVIDVAAVHPSTDPLAWPQLPLPLVAAIGLVFVPALLTRASPTLVPDAEYHDHPSRALRPMTDMVPR